LLNYGWGWLEHAGWDLRFFTEYVGWKKFGGFLGAIS
jgi:hypothetical protein